MNEKQYGIQSAHCISDMSRLPFGQEIYGEWADKHKNILIFDGTNSGTVRRIYEIIQYVARNFKKAGIEIPHTIFRENMESMDGATTACGFIMPDILRRIDFKTSLDWSDELHTVLRYYIPDVGAGDDTLNEAPGMDTKSYHAVVMQAEAMKTATAARIAHAPHLFAKNADPYMNDRFSMAEFSDWMDRQRLA